MIRDFYVESDVRYQTTVGYAERAAMLARTLEDPIERALVAAVAEGSTVKATAEVLGLPYPTAKGIVRRLLR